MIKILEHGTVQIHKCEDCECKFSFERIDCLFHPGKDYLSIACPQCKKEIILEQQKELPDYGRFA